MPFNFKSLMRMMQRLYDYREPPEYPTYECVCKHSEDDHDSAGGCCEVGCDCAHGIPRLGPSRLSA